MKPAAVIGSVMIVGGTVLAVAFWDLRVAWFQGGPFGIAPRRSSRCARSDHGPLPSRAQHAGEGNEVTTDGSSAAEAPRPGDPRSTGPRPPPRARDLGWLALAVALVAITAVQFVGLALALVRVEVRLSGGGMVLGFLITVGWLLVISWFVLGTWRRTVWGCPFDHTPAAPTLRRCERHGTVQGTER